MAAAGVLSARTLGHSEPGPRAEMTGIAKAVDVTDLGQDDGGGGWADPWDRQQSAGPRVGLIEAKDFGVGNLDLGRKIVDQTQASFEPTLGQLG